MSFEAPTSRRAADKWWVVHYLSCNLKIVLTYDATYMGESEGIPRGFESPYERVDDISLPNITANEMISF